MDLDLDIDLASQWTQLPLNKPGVFPHPQTVTQSKRGKKDGVTWWVARETVFNRIQLNCSYTLSSISSRPRYSCKKGSSSGKDVPTDPRKETSLMLAVVDNLWRWGGGSEGMMRMCSWIWWEICCIVLGLGFIKIHFLLIWRVNVELIWPTIWFYSFCLYICIKHRFLFFISAGNSCLMWQQVLSILAYQIHIIITGSTLGWAQKWLH